MFFLFTLTFLIPLVAWFILKWHVDFAHPVHPKAEVWMYRVGYYTITMLVLWVLYIAGYVSFVL